ncbi:hypothetical protein ACFYNO_14030 [Kitasatospora sp. NPDC006697]|uniref:hypothetical protein n=1 Tax=Kitasatospora sp. NPDC006697 TaxID=3364020 RepID=UPI003692162E
MRPADAHPERARRHSAGAHRSPGFAAFLLLTALLLTGGAVATAWWGGANLGYAARLTGTPGVFTVEHCVTTGTGKHRTTSCTGTFRADDGRVLPADPVQDGSLHPGRRVRMQAEGADLHETGVAPIAGWCIALAFAVAMLSGAAQLLVLGVDAGAPPLGARLRRVLWPARVRSAVSAAGAGALGVAMAAAAVFLIAHLAGW